MEARDLTTATRRVNEHPATESLARLGFGASGVLHLLLAVIALQVAWAGTRKNANQSGALATLSQNTFGAVMLWVVAVGFAGLALWQVTEAVTARGRGAGDRVKAVAKFVVYAALAWSALKFAMGGGSSSKKQTQDVTARVMSHQGGRYAIAAVGLVVVGVGAYHIYKGWTRRFLKDLQRNPSRWVVTAGRFGYAAKGVALIVVGFLFVAAAWTKRAKEASGLDGALRTLRAQPYGQWLLTAVAAGIAAYGVYSLARTRYARV